VTITSTVELSIDHETIKTILGEYKMHNALVNIREDITADQLIDVVRGNRVYIPAVTIVNKIDLVDKEHMKSFPKDALKISADMESGLEALREEIYDRLGFINIYLKPQASRRHGRSPYHAGGVHRGRRVRPAPQGLPSEVPVRPGLGGIGQARRAACGTRALVSGRGRAHRHHTK